MRRAVKVTLVVATGILLLITVSVAVAFRDRPDLIQAAVSTPTVQEYKDAAKQISYEDLFRNIETEKGKMIVFDATVIQAQEGTYTDTGGRYQALLVKGDGDGGGSKEIYRLMNNLDRRYLEGDFITVWGFAYGIHTYETVVGGTRNAVMISVIDIQLSTNKEE